jgi:RHS repeat-associated protein
MIGSYADYGYDSLGRNNSIIHKNSSGAVLTQESYSFDPVGNMSSKTVDGLVTSYGYDNADQLVSESRSGYAATYSYDRNGNRLAKVLNGVTEAYTYDDGDKMLTAGTKSYAYDLAGRTQSVTSPSGTTTCAYDDEDRLTSLVGPGVNQQYTYNGLDARRSKISGGVTVNTYKRQGVSPTAPVINDGQATYTPGISERRSGASKFFHSDYLGSNKTLTNSSQTVTDTRSFDAFGLQTGSTGSSPTPFGFAGGWGYQSDGTGLQLLGHRYYDPSTGRFLTRDPIGDGRNWYGYCKNNPLRFIDPSGNIDWDLIADIAGAIDPTGIVDTLHAISYVARGQYGDAAITILGALPGGDALKGAKYVKKATEVVAKISKVAKETKILRNFVKLTGQVHHLISNRVLAAMKSHKALSAGADAMRARLKKQAVDLAAHNGYQKWHRDLDDEIVSWIRNHENATEDEFLRYLDGVYNRPEIKSRFPGNK